MERDHDLRHYGVKGMEWGKKKKNDLLDTDPESTLKKLGFTTAEITSMQTLPWDEQPPALQKKMNAKGISNNNVRLSVQGRNARDRTRNYDAGRQNIKNKNSYQQPPGAKIGIESIDGVRPGYDTKIKKRNALEKAMRSAGDKFTAWQKSNSAKKK